MHRMRLGHVARIEEIQDVAGNLPTAAKRTLAGQLREQYRELGLERRLERLDRTAAAIEKTLCDITKDAEQAARAYDFRTLHDLLKDAEKLQRQATNSFQTIERTERRLIAAARRAAQHARGE
jgi:hypothetical protein